jgi:hypothetical protein
MQVQQIYEAATGRIIADIEAGDLYRIILIRPIRPITQLDRHDAPWLID